MSFNTPSTKNGHVKTKIVRMGRVDLYEPYVFKGDDDTTDEEKKDKKEIKPVYRVNIAYDKDEDADQIKCDLSAIEYVMDKAGWSNKTKAKANVILRDADEDEVPESVGSKKMVRLAVKRPQLEGKYSLSLKSRQRPEVRYLDPETHTFVRLPEPILNPDPDNKEEMEEAQRIKALWDEWVYEGQYAKFTYDYHAYSAATNIGVNDIMMNVLIIGGGERIGRTPFESDFTDDDMTDAIAFLSELKKNEDGGEDDVDEDTGEVKPRRSRSSSKSTRSSRKAKSKYDDDDDFDDDDSDVEDVPDSKSDSDDESSDLF